MPKLALTLFILLICQLVNAQSAGFTFQTSDGLFCAPSTVSFTNTSTGAATGYIWSFGNGISSNAVSPQYTYSTAGTYIVKLVAIYDGAVSETQQTVTVNAGITASLTADRNYICQPGDINFMATSSGTITNYLWDFGDGTGPVSTSIASAAHNYGSFGSFTASVTATDVSGCQAKASYTVDVKKPAITPGINPTSGCIPALVTFSAAVDVPAGTIVSSYSWNFNDGSAPVTSANGSVTHAYTNTGAYRPGVSVVTSEGCTNSLEFADIRFGIPPTAIAASPSKPEYCGSETPEFKATAVNANAYEWNYGDGTIEIVEDSITTHKYTTLGVKTVSVIPYFNGCAGAGTSFQVSIVGVIADFSFANTCSNKTAFQFTDASQGNISSYLWEFGDGSAPATSPNPLHQFSTNGSFDVQLQVADNATGCTDSLVVAIHSGASQLNNPDTVLCRNDSTSFTISNSQTSTSTTYTWNIVGLNPLPTSTGKSITVKASAFGDFQANSVYIDNGPGYCIDTVRLSHPIRVGGPSLYFPDPLTMCERSFLSL